MPRQARGVLTNGSYHVVIRGIGQQRLFEDKEDNMRFLSTLRRYKTQCGFKLHAYCLMSNHVHLLMQVEAEPLGQIMKRILVSYASWYNNKYARVGHLFEDRYASEHVFSEAYMLNVVRYIHMNPVNAGICETPKQYASSSYNNYLDGEYNALVDKSLILDIAGSVNAFVEFHRAQSGDDYLDISNNNRMTDNKVAEKIKLLLNCDSPTYIQTLSKSRRSGLLAHLRSEGVSVRQLSRVTGISRGVISQC